MKDIFRKIYHNPKKVSPGNDFFKKHKNSYPLGKLLTAITNIYLSHSNLNLSVFLFVSKFINIILRIKSDFKSYYKIIIPNRHEIFYNYR